MDARTQLIIDRITAKGPISPDSENGSGQFARGSKQLADKSRVSLKKKTSTARRRARRAEIKERSTERIREKVMSSKQQATGSRQGAGSSQQGTVSSRQLADKAVLSTKSKGQSADSKEATDNRTTDYRLQTRHRAEGIGQRAMREALKVNQAGEKLEKKIRERSARLGVIGLGYVGLALAMEMAEAGFHVTGIDIDKEKVKSVNGGISYIPDVNSESLRRLLSQEMFEATDSMAAVESLDAVSICVPTPLRKTKDPDLSYVVAAVDAIRSYLRPEQLIILESTTYPGTTRELVLPALEKSGLQVGKDFFLAFSPERIDPGNPNYSTHNIPKVIGGMTPRCTELAGLIYGQFIERIVPAPDPETAEMVKLLENTFRCVNIALANEMALLCHKLGINVWEVIDGAKTKPFGFMPFYPGPGLGGHCIPVDPYYLTWKARMNGFEPRLIELAGQINGQMPSFMIDRIANALNEHQKSLKGSKILALGVAYKRDTNDIRESPALEVMRALQEKGALVHYSDPCVPSVELNGKAMESVCLTEEILRSMDCEVVLTDHSAFNSSMIATHSPLIIDSRNMLRDFQGPNIVRL